MTETIAPDIRVTLTERAARRLNEIAAGDPSRPHLRISVEGGGCSGFQYKFDLVAGQAADNEPRIFSGIFFCKRRIY